MAGTGRGRIYARQWNRTAFVMTVWGGSLVIPLLAGAAVMLTGGKASGWATQWRSLSCCMPHRGSISRSGTDQIRGLKRRPDRREPAAGHGGTNGLLRVQSWRSVVVAGTVGHVHSDLSVDGRDAKLSHGWRRSNHGLTKQAADESIGSGVSSCVDAPATVDLHSLWLAQSWARQTSISLEDPRQGQQESADQSFGRIRQNGCPAGSRNTRNASVVDPVDRAPIAIAARSPSSRSSTLTSMCDCCGCSCPGHSGAE